MKNFLLSVITFFAVHFSFSQSTHFSINGKVIDAVTKLPLQSASVFTQNTTFGTTTNAEGNFTLRLPNGGYDLIITYTGYETDSKRISTADADNKNQVFEIKQKEKALETVSIVATNEVKDGWEKYGDFFTENFIGKTMNSKNCIIKNNDVLKFYFSKRKNRLKVLATAPVEIENRALGYNIKYTLDSFVYEYGTQLSTYTGYPLFEEMTPSDVMQESVWKTNRQKAYQGSILHFMRSVFNKRLKEEGFEIQFVTKKEDETEQAVVLKDFYGALNYSKSDSSQTVEIMPNQPNVAVVYKNEEPESGYATNEDESKKFQLSVINVNANQQIVIEQNGYYYDQNDITLTGYWMWEKTADMVPYDYKPGL